MILIFIKYQFLKKNQKGYTFYGNDDNKYIKTKIKIFKDRVNTTFYNEEVPKEKVPEENV